ncbi:MAG: CHASE2 domain-containing protein [Terriglobia bacterium]
MTPQTGRMAAGRSALLVRLVCLGSILLWIGLLLVVAPSLLERFELAALDTELRLAPAPRSSPAIVIVAMDERAVHRYGPGPWSLARVAEVIRALERSAPRVIALDFVFTGEREREGRLVVEARAGQQPLLAALEQSGKVVLGSYFDFDSDAEAHHVAPVHDFRVRRVRRLRYQAGVTPGDAQPPVPRGTSVHTNTPALSIAARAYGHLNLVLSRAGIVRWIPLVARYQDDFYTAFAVEVARTYLGDVPPEVLIGRGRMEGLRLGERFIDTDEHGRLLVRFAGRRGTYPTFSVADLLDGRIPAERLRDRIVLVGATAAAGADFRATPLDPQLPGVEIHANAVDNLLQGHFLVRNWFTRQLTFFLLGALGLVGALVLPRTRGFRRLGVVAAVFVGALLVGHYWVFTRTGYALSLVSPLLATATLLGGTLVVKHFTEEKQRQQLERSFEHYLDRNVIAELMERPERLRLGGERREVSMLFCDIRNFTTLAEGIPPEASVEMLNEFFTAMTGVVFATGGLVDKFVGDQIMAFWGAPVERNDHAANACAAALGMMEEFRRLRTGWAQSQPTRQTMNCGVGINSGPVVVGNIGSARRFSYTVIGDNVNVAARLEALNKLYGTQILVGPATYAAVRERFRLREIDRVRVRGRTQPLTVYELLGRLEQPLPEEAWLAAFAEGLAAYRRREWAAAAEAFAAARARNPADACAEFYLSRAQQFAENPPPEEWEGVLYLR